MNNQVPTVEELQAISTKAYEEWLDAQKFEWEALRNYQKASADVIQARVRQRDCIESQKKRKQASDS